MKNLIVSYDKLPEDIIQAISNKYPHGFYHETFELEIPSQEEEVHVALRYSDGATNYIIKVESFQKNIDRPIADD